MIVGALGSKFWNEEGTTWIDFSSMLVNMNLGHQHPKMIQAIKDQADVLCMVAPPFANDQRSEAARLIVEKANRDGAGGHFEKVFFTNAGAEAVENAVRLAKGYTGRMKVLSAYRSYHGGTALSVGLTGEPRRLENEPSVPGLVKFWGPYPYRSAFHSDSPEQETERALQHLRETILAEGADKIAAIILESVVGTNGVLVPPPGYLEGLRALCDEFGIVWIADEVMSGFGRAGQWFAWQNWDAQPDLICFAKGVNSGYVPLGGVVISSDIAHAYDTRVFPGGLTYWGTRWRARRPSRASASSRRRACSPTPAISATTSSGRRSVTSPSGTRRSARCAGWACSGPSISSQIPRPASPLPRRLSGPWLPSASATGCGRCPPATGSTWCRPATPPTSSPTRASPSSTPPSPPPTQPCPDRSREPVAELFHNEFTRTLTAGPS